MGSDANFVATSGISSGGYMASQLHYIYSSTVKAHTAIISGSYMSGEKVFEMAGLPASDNGGTQDTANTAQITTWFNEAKA